jgi:SAM-dependent methyltransferase
VRWLRRRRAGRLASLGHDYDLGHRKYVEALEPAGIRWLTTKPFSAPPSEELARCLHTFAHVVERLNLGLRGQILDVGCGPGWLSELLARSGYRVTGIDISPDMIRIAEERVAAIPRPLSEGVEDPIAEFFAMPVRELPWTDRFDAAVLYDTLHHFDDEVETLRVILRSLVPGGLIYIEEGVRPPPGSEAERTLTDEMRRYGTLESPFDPEYLVDVLDSAGFENVIRYARVDELLDIGAGREAVARIKRRMRYPDLNTIVAARPVTVGGEEPDFRGRIDWAGAWEARDGVVVFFVAVTNEGRTFWPSAARFPYPRGAVMLGPYLEDTSRGRVELPRTGLPHALPPGESVGLGVVVPESALAGAEELTIDLVREGFAWFSELGSEPLVVPIPGR